MTRMVRILGLTLPAPIDKVRKIDVENIRTLDVGSNDVETLMLTGDQNIIDIAYQVRWSIRDPEQFLFELRTPEDTIRQVAESSMRQVVAQVSLQDAIGNRRGPHRHGRGAPPQRDGQAVRLVGCPPCPPGRGGPALSRAAAARR